jgi:hypothetical protein
MLYLHNKYRLFAWQLIDLGGVGLVYLIGVELTCYALISHLYTDLSRELSMYKSHCNAGDKDSQRYVQSINENREEGTINFPGC